MVSPSVGFTGCATSNLPMEEEGVDDVTQCSHGLRRIDRRTELGASVESFRVPGPERPQFVDDPAFVRLAGSLPPTLADVRPGRGVAESRVLVNTLPHEEVDVLEKESASLGVGDVGERFA